MSYILAKTYQELLEVLGPIFNQIIPFLIPGCLWNVILHKKQGYLATESPTSSVSEISCKSFKTHTCGGLRLG